MKGLLLAAPLALGLGCSALDGFVTHADPDGGFPPEGSYAIVASQAVMADDAWRAATVDVLKEKYPHAQVYTWQEHPTEVRTALAETLPTFTAFVVKPEEAGVRFTIDLHHLCRGLDDDPYGDTFWGVITGYDAAAAKLVAAAEPIAIARGLDCSGCDLTAFRQAWRYSEDHRGTMKLWTQGVTEAVQDLPCDTDNTQGVLARLQGDKVQFLATSGHATQHDWQMGYCGPNMTMIHKEGQLLAMDTKQTLHRASNPEPKVYFANGNCLIGDIDRVDCMALSWMRDGGVRQMMGYTVTTWFGAQGWGALGLFVDTAGLCTATEAFHFTNAKIVHELEALGLPETRSFRFEKIEQFNQPRLPALNAWANAQLQAGRPRQEVSETFRIAIGNLHDRDTVCFYGDPALNARLAARRFTLFPPRLTEDALTLTLRVHPGAKDGAVWVRLPESYVYTAEAVEASSELGTPDLLLDNMLRFPSARLAELGDRMLTITLHNPVLKRKSR